MCGIFAYIGLEPIQIKYVLKILSQLEVEKQPIDKTPVGGHGAGIAALHKNKLYFTKIGKGENESPTHKLQEIIESKWSIKEANIILAHVRRASKQFQHTIKYRECTQPYIANCTNQYTVISVHNGFIRNYLELKSKLKIKHNFESEKIELIDSEILPHLMEELLMEYGDNKETTSKLFTLINGNNTAAILTKKGTNASIHIIHKGATRGLYAWKNENTLILCTRQHIIKENIKEQVKELNEIIRIKPRENNEAKMHWKIPSKIVK